MYFISRVLLTIAVLFGLYSLVLIVVLGWPPTGLLLGLLGLGRLGRLGYVHLTSLGSARWAEKRDLCRAGMLGAKSGLILGRTLGRK